MCIMILSSLLAQGSVGLMWLLFCIVITLLYCDRMYYYMKYHVIIPIVCSM